MAEMTQALAQSHLDKWYAADERISIGLSYTIDGRTLTRANAAEVRDQIAIWTRRVESFRAKSAGGNSTAALASWNDI